MTNDEFRDAHSEGRGGLLADHSLDPRHEVLCEVRVHQTCADPASIQFTVGAVECAAMHSRPVHRL